MSDSKTSRARAGITIEEISPPKNHRQKCIRCDDSPGQTFSLKAPPASSIRVEPWTGLSPERAPELAEVL